MEEASRPLPNTNHSANYFEYYFVANLMEKVTLAERVSKFCQPTQVQHYCHQLVQTASIYLGPQSNPLTCILLRLRASGPHGRGTYGQLAGLHAPHIGPALALDGTAAMEAAQAAS